MTKKDYAPINQEVHGVDEFTCALCGGPQVEGSWLQRDHSHEGDGYPRGLLHARCNEKLGHVEKYGTRGETAEHWLMLAQAYLRRARLANFTNED